MNQITIFRDQYEVKIILIWQFSEYLSVVMDAREGLWCGFLCGSGWQDLAWHPLHWILPRTDHGVLVSLSLSQVKWKTRGIRRKNRDSPWFLEPCCVWCCSMVLFCGMYWKIFPGTLLVYDGSYKAAEFIFSGDFCHSLFHWKTYWVFKTAHYWMHLKWWIFASFLRFLLWIVWKDIWVDSYERHRICLRFSPYIKVVFSLMNDMIRYFVILIWSIFSLLSLYLFLHIFGLKDFWVYFGCWSDFLLI